MKNWLFSSGTTRGSFVAVDSDGDTRDCVGVDLVLGVAKGETVEDALHNLLTKLYEAKSLPEYVYKSKNIVAYEITDGHLMDHKDTLQKVTEVKENKVVMPGYQPKACCWCKNTLPSNGAAQFSHLSKHVNELVSKGLLTKEQAATIRSIKLTPEIETIFTGHYHA